jgi:PEGA domain
MKLWTRGKAAQTCAINWEMNFNDGKTMRRISTFAFFMILLFHQAAAAQDGYRVAALEFLNKTEISQDEARHLTEIVRETALQTLPADQFIILTHENIKSMLPPDMSLAKCVSGSCEVDVGRKIGVDYIVTGEVFRFSGELRVRIKLHHSMSGAFLGGRTAQATSLKDLEKGIAGPAQKIMYLLLKHSKNKGGFIATGAMGPEIKNPGYLDVSGFPAGSMIFIDDKPREAVDESGGSYFALPPGGYSLRIATHTGKEMRQEILIESGKKIQMAASEEMAKAPAAPSTSHMVILRVESVYTDHKGRQIPETGAKIIIDGKDTGKSTPAGVKIKKPGLHKIDLIKPLFHSTRNFAVVLEPDKSQQSVTVPLNPAFAPVRFDSKPPGAQILIDGKSKGRAPYENPRFESGMFELSFRYENYHDLTETIIVKDNEAFEKVYEMKPAYAMLGIDIKPKDAQGAKVYLDQEFFAKAPSERKLVPSGEYLLTVKHSKYKEYNERITLVDGQEITLPVSMSANWAILEIETQPCPAQIIIDGQDMGQSDKKAKSIDTLKPGDHFLELKPADTRYRAMTKTIMLENQELLRLEESFEAILTRLVLDSEPSGARVFLDGKKLSDPTPIIQEIIIGRHHVRLEAPAGFVPMEESIDLEAKPENEITLKFSKKGMLKISSSPSGATVRVDGSYKGLTPVTVKELDSGSHSVGITKAGMLSFHKDVFIDDGKTTKLKADLEAFDLLAMRGSDPFLVMGTGFLMTPGDRKLHMKLEDSSETEIEEVMNIEISDADMGDYLVGGHFDTTFSRSALRILMLSPGSGSSDSANNPKKVHLGFVIGGFRFKNKIRDGSVYTLQGGFYPGYTHRWGRLAECLDLMVLWTDYNLKMKNKQGVEMKYKTKTPVMDFIPRNRLIYYLMKDPYAVSGAFITFDLMMNLSNIPAVGGGGALGYQW